MIAIWGPGYIPDHIFESLLTIFDVKILSGKFFVITQFSIADSDLGCGVLLPEIRVDPECIFRIRNTELNIDTVPLVLALLFHPQYNKIFFLLYS